MISEHFSYKIISGTRYLRELSRKTIIHGNGGSDRVVGREGGGGVMGESYINFEEEQTAANGRTDTNGSGPTLNFFM